MSFTGTPIVSRIATASYATSRSEVPAVTTTTLNPPVESRQPQLLQAGEMLSKPFPLPRGVEQRAHNRNHFVARIKYQCLRIEKYIPPSCKQILADKIITNTRSKSLGCTHNLRFVRSVDIKTSDIIDILTNNLNLMSLLSTA